MKPRYRFTKADFRRWLKSTRKSMVTCDGKKCALACFLVSTGEKNPSVGTLSRRAPKGGKRIKLPAWAASIVKTFDRFSPISPWRVSSGTARWILRNVA